MTAFVVQQEWETVRVPEWVTILSSFRRWATSDRFPEHGWYAYLNGEIWVDPSMERAGHNRVKTKVGAVLTIPADDAGRGQYFCDRMLLTNTEAGLATEPDGMYLSNAAIRSRRVTLTEDDDSVEVVGSPDMVLEVVSPSSRQKDTAVLRELYWLAGVREYWLVDPTGEQIAFDVLRRGPRGYVSTRRQPGDWLKSVVFGRSFRLTRQTNRLEQTVYTLSIR